MLLNKRDNLEKLTDGVLYLKDMEIHDIYSNCEVYRYSIIGLPPTLPRVLTALGDNYTYIFHGIFQLNDYDNDIGTQYEIGDRLCEWDLSKDNLFDQSEETQKAIGDLLGVE